MISWWKFINFVQEVRTGLKEIDSKKIRLGKIFTEHYKLKKTI